MHPDPTLQLAGDGPTNQSGSAQEGERLHKVLAQQGLGSRRKMEALIASGEVEVNGQRAQVGQVVTERDRVHVRRRKVKVRIGDDNPRVLIYHKPTGEIVSRDDPENRVSVFDRLPRPDHGKWVAVGRLDYNSEGLLLFTTFGELANRLMHPRYEVSREYSVRVLGELTPEQEDQLIDGIELEDGPARVTQLERIEGDSEGVNHWYKLTLQEGRNREVRRMFEHLGLTVSRLIRTRYGPVHMPSWLKRGQWKLLDEHETFNLLESVGLRSRKKLEKAARFGGARGKLPAAPVGPMRSATEHSAAWMHDTSVGISARPGRAGRSMRTAGRNGGLEPVALQQQQFPGFGGFETNLSGVGGRSRRQRGKRFKTGDINGHPSPAKSSRPGTKNRVGRQAAQAVSAESLDQGANGGPGGGRRQRRRRGGQRPPAVDRIGVPAPGPTVAEAIEE